MIKRLVLASLAIGLSTTHALEAVECPGKSGVTGRVTLKADPAKSSDYHVVHEVLVRCDPETGVPIVHDPDYDK
jgi:hypothetical protein